MRNNYHPAIGYNLKNLNGSENFRERLRRLQELKLKESNKKEFENNQIKNDEPLEETPNFFEEFETKVVKVPFNFLHIKI